MDNNIISVSELTGKIQSALEFGIGFVNVKGEISNYKLHSSGHRYFTLKDEGASVACTLWRGKPLNFQPSDGMKVIVQGKLTVYPPRGQYQIEVSTMSPHGQGDLFMAFEALKKKLGEQGYFSPENKKPIPHFPKNIGVITSPTGAAVQDIFSTLKRRLPLVNVYFRPAIVQGDEAAPDLVKAINEMHKFPVDVIIFGRGGGSLEDLWAFNMENVADTIFHSKIPIVSAVGHETDFTISDFVSDVRAATPTAAAELVTPITKDYLLNHIEDLNDDLVNITQSRLDDYRKKIDAYIQSYGFRRFIDRIRTKNQYIDEMQSRLDNNCTRLIKSYQTKFSYLESHYHSLNPLSPLKKGFALLIDGENIITNKESLSKHKNIIIQRLNETAYAEILNVETKG